MPSLGADMEYGTVLEWFVKPGDEVHRGDIVALVHTEKADIEVEIFEDGIIGELLVPIGEEVPVGASLAAVLTPGESRDEPTPSPPTPNTPAPRPVVPAVPSPKAGERPRVSPRARRLAAERGIDITQLSTAEQVITGADVERAGPTPKAAVEDQQAAMRRAIAAAMSRSNREIPHYHLLHDTPLSHALAWLEQRNAARSVADRVLPVAVFCRAVVLAIARVPGLNGTWVDDAFRTSDRVHLGFAVSMRGGGLIAPAVIDADQKDLDALMTALRDLTNRVRARRLRGREMTDATITVTNLGARSVEVVHGVIYPPQVALVGFGTVTERAWVEDGVFAARPVVSISLAGDHRASDGHLGGRFLAEIDHLLRTPEEL
jgi:pyruvate dehydrogenase E2 component (dihydrolipoamide acetyltransferase)